MRYLCQVWFDGTILDRMNEAEKQTLDRDSLAYDRKLERGGHLIRAEALQSPASAVTVKVRNGTTSSTDGPFIETKEHLGGFILIEASDMEEAVEIAAGIPLAKLGSIEVRPIYTIPEREMDYVCLIYLDETKFAAMSQAERDGHVNAMLDNDDAMRASGHYVTSNALQAPINATSVRVRSGKLSVTDGPFAETKEHLSGYIVIRARDLNEAIQVAGRIPLSATGTIEVRPVETIARIEP